MGFPGSGVPLRTHSRCQLPKHAWLVKRKWVWDKAVEGGPGEDCFGEAIVWGPRFVIGWKTCLLVLFGIMELWVPVLFLCSQVAWTFLVIVLGWASVPGRAVLCWRLEGAHWEGPWQTGALPASPNVDRGVDYCCIVGPTLVLDH